MIVYLASAIDQLSVEESAAQEAHVRDLRNKIGGWGHTVFTPKLAWKTTSSSSFLEDAAALDAVNRMALRKATVLVAWLPAGVASVGVPTEIEMHTANDKPAIVIGDADSMVLDANPLVSRIRNPDWTTILQRLQGELEEARGFPAEDTGAVLKSALDRALAKPHRTVPYIAGNDRADALSYAFSQGLRGATPAASRDLPYKLAGDEPGTNPAPLDRTFADDAGLDLVTTTDVHMDSGGWTKIPCGVAVGLPADVFGWVVARSSTFEKWGIIVLPGIIDPGYRGELGVSALMIDSNPGGTLVPAGTRLAQLLIMPNLAPQFKPRSVDEFMVSAHQRGTNGWGSSGS